MKLLENLDIEEFKKEDSFKDVNISEYLNTLLESHGLQAKDVILKLNMERCIVLHPAPVIRGRM